MSNHPPLNFLLENDNLKLCSICGEEKQLSFEHMPPKSSGNTNAVNIIGIENMTPYGGFLYEKFSKSRKGFGGYKLCEECNNKTGAWYANSYIELSNQLTKAINENIGIKDVVVSCKVKPLNFLKQVICILLCSDQATGQLRRILGAKKLMLKKENKKIPSNLFISMNITVQPTFGFKGFIPMIDNIHGFRNNIEFVYRPFAFFLTINDVEKGPEQSNLIKWANYKYDEETDIEFGLQIKKFGRTACS